MKTIKMYGDIPAFCGNEVSEYGIKCGYVDYATFAKSFDAVLNNEIMNVFPDYWEPMNFPECNDDDDDGDYYDDLPEIFQYYIVSSYGAEQIEYWTDDPLFYNEQLDMYVWGVTHWGTSWDYVLTDIKIEK